VSEPFDLTRFDETMLLLGRLDGRLQNSPCADIFLARARLEGAAKLAILAGVPIAVADLQAWIAGRTPPPRVTEGLNDPLSVAAVFHLAISREEDDRDPLVRASLRTLRTVLDDRVDAETYGAGDLVYYGPLWRQIRQAADAPFPHRSLLGVAQRVFEMAELTGHAAADAATVVSIDGRSLTLPPRARDRNWLIASAVPQMLRAAGITLRVIPSLVLLPKFLPASPDALAPMLAQALAPATVAALRDLDRIERQARRIAHGPATKRSKAPLLARLQLAYPGLNARAVVKLLNVTPQGARKLLVESGAIVRSSAALADRGNR
jgi:hypothetical protein